MSLAKPGQPKPFQAQVRRGGKLVSLGSFATAEEAALCVTRSPEGRAAAVRPAAARRAAACQTALCFARSPEGQAVAAERAAAAVPLTSEEARQQAQAEGPTLVEADESKTGYYGVTHRPGRSKPYETRVWRGGKDVYLGSFTTAEEAALCIARSPEGRAAAGRAAPAESQGMFPAILLLFRPASSSRRRRRRALKIVGLRGNGSSNVQIK